MSMELGNGEDAAAGGWRNVPSASPRLLHPAGSALQIALALPFHSVKVPDQVRLHGAGEHGEPILIALAPRTKIWLGAKSTSCSRSRARR